MRPQLHFTAPFNWINDPNGLIYFQGNYHLFYQHFPYDTSWGTMHWGHAITKDFINFKHLPFALYPSKDFDRNGCFSGSALEIKGKMYLYYTAIRYAKENPDYVHVQDGDDQLRASQALLISDDGLHFDNKNQKQQIIPMIQEAYLGDYRHTRDPKVWQKTDGKYALAVGSKVAYQNDYCGKVLFYESEDGINFTYKNSYGDSTIGNMWECPDVFQLDNQYIMIFSPENTDLPPKPVSNGRYMTVDFEETSLTIKGHGEVLYLDYGLDLYAPQTFIGKDQQRILIAWLRMPKPVDNEEWIGMYCMPRVLQYHDGHLYQQLLPEIAKTFTKPTTIDFSRPFKLTATLKADSYLNLGGFIIDIQDDCLHLNRTKVFTSNKQACNEVYSPKLKQQYQITLYYDYHVFEIYLNDGLYVMSQIVYDLTNQVVLENVDIEVYGR